MLSFKETISRLRKDPKDAWYYVQGSVRYWLYTNGYKGLIRGHIREQYEYRKKAASACYKAGECRCCSCRTPELFFADKGCSIGKKGMPGHCQLINEGKPCYGPMLSRWDLAVAQLQELINQQQANLRQ